MRPDLVVNTDIINDETQQMKEKRQSPNYLYLNKNETLSSQLYKKINEFLVSEMKKKELEIKLPAIK